MAARRAGLGRDLLAVLLCKEILFAGSSRGSSTSASVMALPPRRVTTTTDDAAALNKIVKAAEAYSVTGKADVEEIFSFYWWKGAVQKERESRVSFAFDESQAALEQVIASIASVHNYDVPMIVAECEEMRSSFWKGTIRGGTGDMAAALTQARLVACAQLSQTDSAHPALAIKTVTAAKPLVESLLRASEHDIEWTPIDGNKAYLDWITASTHAPDTA